jgi:hypothetical protein
MAAVDPVPEVPPPQPILQSPGRKAYNWEEDLSQNYNNNDSELSEM